MFAEKQMQTVGTCVKQFFRLYVKNNIMIIVIIILEKLHASEGLLAKTLATESLVIFDIST